MARARAEARWRASQKASALDTPDQEGPAYRFRESRFVPREHYGKAIDRANELRASRAGSRETSRPGSRVNGVAEEDLFVHAAEHDQHQQSRQNSYEQEVQASSTKLSNGFGLSSIPRWEPPAATSATGAFSSIPQQSAWSFVDSGSRPTQPFNAFGQQAASQGSASLSPPPVVSHGSVAVQEPDNHNFTIEPSQVRQILSNSFGQPQPSGRHAKSAIGHSRSPSPPAGADDQVQSASEVISLLSDDEADDSPRQLYSSQYAQRNGTLEEYDEDGEGHLDAADEEEVPDSYQYTEPNSHATNPPTAVGGRKEDIEPDPHGTNPFSVLADQYGGDTEEDAGIEPGYESGGEGSYDDDDDEAQGLPAPNGYHNEGGYGDEEASDGDIEDSDDFEEDDGEMFGDGAGQNGMVSAPRRHGDRAREESEEFEEFEDDETEDEGAVDSRLDRRAKAPTLPTVSPALQVVGHTAEEAIELSD
ncbi:hypothetical protein LTR53_012995 [Teratosphaeriaceae sp. CCFEE 6253]|nr:hypothetical protein LTR53_012995 [Teratosphaeriaceae sp. CCFEE 6253]